MKCAICSGDMRYYFSKEFHEPHIRPILNCSDYHQCCRCGFTASKTLTGMPFPQMGKLNSVFHTALEKESRITPLDQPPYIHQIQMLHILSEHNIVSLTNAIDYAAGYGNIVRLLQKYYGKSLLLFDPFMQQNDGEVSYVSKDQLGKYDTVFTSAFFEHFCKAEISRPCE